MNQDKPLELSHDYDGIEELDNDLPRWWLGIFWATALLALFYVPYYHWMRPDKLPANAWEKADAERRTVLTTTDQDNAQQEGEDLTALYEKNDWQEDGKMTYRTFCVPCHAADGGGGIGPNMTDDYYIHGGTLADLVHIVSEGVPSKGMVPWKASLRPDDIRAVAFYLRSLRGTTAANPIPAQGELVDSEGRIQADLEAQSSSPVE